jgi:hypothetical protein
MVWNLPLLFLVVDVVNALGLDVCKGAFLLIVLMILIVVMISGKIQGVLGGLLER